MTGGVEHLTVRALIEKLQAQDPDAKVLIEGCDCTAPATGVTCDEDGSVTLSYLCTWSIGARQQRQVSEPEGDST